MSKDTKEIELTKKFLNSLPEEQIEFLRNALSELQKEREKESAHIPGRYKGEHFWRYNWGTDKVEKRVITPADNTDFFQTHR